MSMEGPQTDWRSRTVVLGPQTDWRTVPIAAHFRPLHRADCACAVPVLCLCCACAVPVRCLCCACGFPVLRPCCGPLQGWTLHRASANRGDATRPGFAASFIAADTRFHPDVLHMGKATDTSHRPVSPSERISQLCAPHTGRVASSTRAMPRSVNATITTVIAGQVKPIITTVSEQPYQIVSEQPYQNNRITTVIAGQVKPIRTTVSEQPYQNNRMIRLYADCMLIVC